MLERLKEIKRTATYPLSQEAADALEKIDREMEAQMLHAEKKCRKFYANHYEFSPTVQQWLDRCHLYRALIRLKLKMERLQTTNVRILGDGNPANIYRAARRCEIDDPKSLGKEELYFRYRECKERTKELMASSPWMRKQFLSAKLVEAVD